MFRHLDDLRNLFFPLMHSMREFISPWADKWMRVYFSLWSLFLLILSVRLDSILLRCICLWCVGWCLNMSICALFLKLFFLNIVEVLLLSSFELNVYVVFEEMYVGYPSSLSVWSQIVLAKSLSKEEIVGYLYVGLIFAKTNIQTRCWTQCFNRWLRLQCALISCLDSAYLEIYFKREDS